MMFDFFPNEEAREEYRRGIAYLRKIAPEGRCKLMLELSEAERLKRRAEIRERHPDYTEQQITLAYIRLVHGEEIFRQFFPDSNIET